MRHAGDMPRSREATRQRILDAAYAQFYRRGFARIGVDEIAQAARVTKRTLYNHFTSKDRLIGAMLEDQHHRALAAFRAWSDKLSDDPVQFAEELFADLIRWSAKPRWTGSGYTRLTMELADLPGHPARAIARRHKATIEAHIADLFAKARMPRANDKARQFCLLMEGATCLMLIHGDPRYATAACEAAKALLTPARKR